ncbi:hypothetical protein [Ligilactobacillus murinus]|uniref:hypothetical protein n=1 Tax=Ligilactobacillus murinus TaxID=1622 RepID=UPI000B5C9A79|nr:hypothetical protein [Ligilactobacillus murinus]
MFKTQINADVPINEGSGQIVTELPFVPHKGDFIMVGDEQTQWEVVSSTFIVHDKFHPKKVFVDLVVKVKQV